MKDIQILVLDDSPSFILYITDLFKKHGYKNFYVAYDKDMAEQILKENHIQIVLLDIELNTIKEGFQFGEYIQKHYDLPVIYITGKNEEEIKSLLEQRNKDMIFYGLLYKPFKFSELEILIQNAIQNVYHKKIQEKSLKRLLELIPEPTVVIHKNQIYDYNNLFINFIKKIEFKLRTFEYIRYYTRIKFRITSRSTNRIRKIRRLYPHKFETI